MRPRLVVLSAAAFLLLPISIVYAHERFIRHDLKYPMHERYFGRIPGAFLGIQPDMFRIATTSCVLLFIFLAIFFKYIQVFLAILMLTQTALPLAGALVIGTWIYLWRWGWMVAADAIPVVTVAVLYLSAPWQSHKVAITEMSEKQVKWVRLVLGFGFFALGWLKIYNYHLTAGVADNYPSVMDDPMISFFSVGTNPLYRRENWIIAFALAEVLSGFMLMVGVFTRVWGSLMLWVFTKLMLVNFGWDEIPHIYPIAATMAVVFSSKVHSEFAFVERIQQRLAREGRTLLRLATVVTASLVISVLTVYVLLYAFTFIDRSHL